MLENIRVYKKMYIAILITLAFAVAGAIVFNIIVKPYAVYADGTRVDDPCIVSADGEELFIVENEDIAGDVIRSVMESYVAEDGDLDSIQIDEELKIEDKTLFVGVKPPVVLTEEEAVAKVLESNATESPMMHVTTKTDVDITEKVEPETVYEKTDNLYEGNMELKSEGKEGEKIVTNEVTIVNGEETDSEPVDEKVTQDPVDRVVYLGTKARPADTAWRDYSGEILGQADGTEMVNYGLQFVGNPYRYGGTSLTNGTDCSGFIYAIYNHFGYRVPRLGFYKMGKGVCLAEAKPGDVVYYPGHYAMYMGDGKIVHAYNHRAGICVSSVH
ncbi:MAG: G5 domain-containing protein, partial [Bacillota bacterium]